jgi:hypothetical protein
MKIKTDLTKICDGIYLCEMDNRYDLAMTFCRVQEFYESAFKEIRGKSFSMMKFQRLYSLKREGCFSYPLDWAGFNIPSSILEKFYKGDWMSNDWNEYDGVFKKIVNQIGEDKPFYLIASEKNQKQTVDHELCHAFYNLNKDYKSSVDKMINSIPKTLLNKMKKVLKDTGYCDRVMKDEIQAYLSCDHNYFSHQGRLSDIDDKRIEKFEKLFQNHFNKHISLNITK